MTPPVRPEIDPDLDLVLERVVDAPPERIWRAWTEPEHLVKWFCPRPWTTVACELDPRPGGAFNTTMRSPEGEVQEPSLGCFLEVVEHERLVWTDALSAGYRPAARPFLTGMLLLEPVGSGTRYTAIAKHVDPAAREQHERMGFHAGWGTALDQLLEVARSLDEGDER